VISTIVLCLSLLYVLFIRKFGMPEDTNEVHT